MDTAVKPQVCAAGLKGMAANDGRDESVQSKHE
jgi:hypothetical protein